MARPQTRSSKQDRSPIATAMGLREYWRSGRRSGKRLCSFRLAAILHDACSPDEATVFGRVIRGRPEFFERAAPDYAELSSDRPKAGAGGSIRATGVVKD